MNIICKTMDGNQYDQLFVNNAYFAKVYPIDSKSKSGDALNCYVKSLVYLRRYLFVVLRNSYVRGTYLLKRSAGKVLIITSVSLTFTTRIQLRVSLGN